MTTDELRARVATKVMHWHQEPGPDDRMYYTSAVGKFVMPVAEWDPLDDANHRDMVVQAMERAGWHWQVGRDQDNAHAGFWQIIEGVWPVSAPAAMSGVARDQCVGIAIMRAALAALEDEHAPPHD